MDLDLDHEAIIPPQRLCSVCEPIVDFYSCNFDTMEVIEVPGGLPEHLIGPNSSFRKYHANFSDMRRAATLGCHFCSVLAHCLDSIPHEEPDQQIYITYSKRGTFHNFVLWYLSVRGNPASWIQAGYVPFLRADSARGRKFLEDFGDDMLAMSSPLCWYAGTGSSALRKLMADCLHQCTQNHKSCNERLEGQMPTRLLDINAFEDCQDLRLVSNLSKDAQAYAALSYCWGNRVTTKLQRSNITDFTSRILLEHLPKTVREAVDICRGLSLRYLWVDALCIIQDDSKDFEQEVARMGSIYAGALVTIAAADSEDCDGGLYRPRKPLGYARLMLGSPSSPLAIFRSLHCSPYGHGLGLSETSLSKRAWAYQERVMSPRTIHFTEGDIIWECRERATCSHCTNRDSHLKDYKFKRKFTNLRQASTGSVANTEIPSAWLDVTRNYSGTNLTYEDDRLSALAGIAQLVSQNPSYKASHGLWLPFFLDELLWSISDTQDIKYHGVDRVDAPSWAWHRNGPNNFSHDSLRGDEQVLYSCTFTTLPRPTPFGQLSSLQPASFKVRGGLHSCRVMATKGKALGIDTTKYSLKQTGHGGPPGGPWSAPQGHSTPWYVCFRPDRDMAEQDVVCLTLRRTLSKFGNWCVSTDRGLVLAAVVTDKRIYRRIGYFVASLDNELPWTWEEEEVEIV